MLFLIVPRLADVDVLVDGEPPRPAFIVTGEEHDETAIDNLFNGMIAILARLDHFVFIKMAIESMDRLLRPVIPTGVDPFTSFAILPRAIYLCDNGFGKIIGVLNVDPITCKCE